MQFHSDLLNVYTPSWWVIPALVACGIIVFAEAIIGNVVAVRLFFGDFCVFRRGVYGLVNQAEIINPALYIRAAPVQ